MIKKIIVIIALLLCVISVMFFLKTKRVKNDKNGEVNVNDSQIEINVDKNSVGENETFSISLNVNSLEGINAFGTKYEFDNDALELEDISIVNEGEWINFGGDSELILMCNTEKKICNAELCKMVFRVKNNTLLKKANIKFKDIFLDRDMKENSQISFDDREIEIDIK